MHMYADICCAIDDASPDLRVITVLCGGNTSWSHLQGKATTTQTVQITSIQTGQCTFIFPYDYVYLYHRTPIYIRKQLT